MTKGILGDREKALEENYFRQQDARLLAKLRQGAALDDVAVALAEKLQVDSPELLSRVREAGVMPESAAAFLLAPLVEVAWAEGKVSKPERETVLRLARDRGIDADSPAHAQLVEWLANRPSDALFDAAVEVLRAGFSVLPPREREERIKRIVEACREVAAASGTEVARLLGLGDGVSDSEASLLGTLAERLHGRT